MSIVISALLALSASTPAGLWTLCLGADGHRVLELACSPDLPRTAGQQPVSPPGACAPEQCFGCQDFDISSGLALRETHDLGTTSSFPAPALPDCGVVSNAYDTATIHDALSESIPAPLEHPLDTILIRC
jgi:hypothetical protein